MREERNINATKRHANEWEKERGRTRGEKERREERIEETKILEKKTKNSQNPLGYERKWRTWIKKN